MAGMSGATSSYGGGQGSLTASPWQRDTRIDDVRSFGGFGTNRPRPIGTARNQTLALAPRQALSGPDPSKALERAAVRQAQAAADIAEAKARAMTTAAPTKQLHGFNMAGRIMDDPENLTGAQREVFLPDDSRIVDSGSDGPTAHLSPDAPGAPQQPDDGYAMRTWMQMEALKRRG